MIFTFMIKKNKPPLAMLILVLFYGDRYEKKYHVKKKKIVPYFEREHNRRGD